MSKQKVLQQFNATFGLEDACAFLVLDAQNDVVKAHGLTATIIPNEHIATCLSDTNLERYCQWNFVDGPSRVTVSLVRFGPTTVRWVLKLERSNGSSRLPEGVAVGEIETQALAVCQKELIPVDAWPMVKAFPFDNLNEGLRDLTWWNRGQMYVNLDKRSLAAKKFRTDRIDIEKCTRGALGNCVAWKRDNEGARIEGKLTLTSDSTVLMTIKLTSSRKDAEVGMIVLQLSAEQINRFRDIKDVCFPMAGQAYQVMRDSFYHGDGAHADMVKDGLNSRLSHLSLLTETRHEGIRDKLGELIAVLDAMFEVVTGIENPNEVITAAERFIENVQREISEHDAKKIAELEKLNVERARKSNAIATVADMQRERERQRQRSNAQSAKKNRRTKPIAACVLMTPENDVRSNERDAVTADSAGDESHENDGHADEGQDDGPKAKVETDAPHRTAAQERLYRSEQEGKLSVMPTLEIVKPKAPIVEGRKLTFQEQLALVQPSAPATLEAVKPEAPTIQVPKLSFEERQAIRKANLAAEAPSPTPDTQTE
jgi:hypothetical protein